MLDINKWAFILQSDKNYIPLFLEKCVKFIETEGLDSEGIYRVPGNRAHVDLLFQKFEEGSVMCFIIIWVIRSFVLSDVNVDIHELDIPVNAVATALKDFVSKRLPPLFEDDVMAELEDITGNMNIKTIILILIWCVHVLIFLGTRMKPMVTTTGNIEVKTDKSCRLLALRSMLDKLPPINFQVLKFIFQHFVK